jgi:hypothetical protein
MKKLFFAAALLFTASLYSCADEAAEITPNNVSNEVASDDTDTNGTGNVPPKKPGSN